jgi:hypothetical protein
LAQHENKNKGPAEQTTNSPTGPGHLSPNFKVIASYKIRNVLNCTAIGALEAGEDIDLVGRALTQLLS